MSIFHKFSSLIFSLYLIIILLREIHFYYPLPVLAYLYFYYDKKKKQEKEKNTMLSFNMAPLYPPFQLYKQTFTFTHRKKTRREGGMGRAGRCVSGRGEV